MIVPVKTTDGQEYVDGCFGFTFIANLFDLMPR
jgi:hypothetical protein